ncbi:MAG TPA: helix-turn-helix domain-containing protein [Lacunisphaera sp.]|nr:helix-turn-helix domain-containing protein [Lacunisphaera sp.]
MSARDLLRTLADILAERLESEESGREYYDQKNSPLTPDTHMRLVRCGALPGYKVGGRILVKRADMHAFIEAHKVQPVAGAKAATVDDAVRELREQYGIKGSNAA